MHILVQTSCYQFGQEAAIHDALQITPHTTLCPYAPDDVRYAPWVHGYNRELDDLIDIQLAFQPRPS